MHPFAPLENTPLSSDLWRTPAGVSRPPCSGPEALRVASLEGGMRHCSRSAPRASLQRASSEVIPHPRLGEEPNGGRIN